MLDQFKTVGMLFAFLGSSTGTASAFTPPYNTCLLYTSPVDGVTRFLKEFDRLNNLKTV